MIEFKPVRLEDKQIIERHTMPSGILNCDLAFANMYCWQAMYHSAWAVIDGFLVIRFHIGGSEKIGYMQPVGEGDFAGIIPALREDAHAHGQRLRLIGLTDEGREMIRNMHAGLFAFESDRALEDYVYNAEDLRNLTGRRYQPKRNHINRFVENNPTWTYEEITPATLPECLEMDKEWYRRSLQREGDAEERDLGDEGIALRTAMEHYEELGLEGGLIRVYGEVVAFTIGDRLSADTYDVHFEKAYGELQGAYAMINREFARWVRARHPEIRYLNREDDMGVEGLRKAKQSYYPDLMVEKHTAVMK